jgi:hypothetical protein
LTLMATPVHARYALLAALLLAPAVACSFLIGSDAVQCSSPTDCTSRGDLFANTTCSPAHVCVSTDAGADAPPADAGADAPVDAADEAAFGCANTPYPQDESLTRSVTYTRTFQDVNGNKPLTQIGVRICGIDPTCSNPRAQPGGTTVFPDSNGKVTVEVGYGFRGLIEVNNLDGGQQVVTPAFLQVNPPLIQDASAGPNALMVSPSTFLAVAVQVFDAGAVTPGLAHLFFRTHDCLDNSLAGISVEADKQDTQGRTRSFYFVQGNVPNPDATETDVGGKGGILNLPPSSAVTLTARFHATGTVLGTAVVSLRADYITYVILTPSN